MSREAETHSADNESEVNRRANRQSVFCGSMASRLTLKQAAILSGLRDMGHEKLHVCGLPCRGAGASGWVEKSFLRRG